MTSQQSMGDGTVIFIYTLCALAVLCNIALLVVIGWSRRLRSSTDLYLVNLAISDVIMSGVAMPLKLVNAAYGHFHGHGGVIVCKVVMFSPMLAIMSCICTLVAIAFDRFFALVKERMATTRQVLVSIVVIWVISAATSGPQLYEYSIADVIMDNETVGVCGSHDIPESFELYYAIIILVLCYVIPLVLLCCCYGSLAVFIWQRSKMAVGIGADGTVNLGKVSEVKVHVVKMLAILTSVFAILWMPYFVMFTIEEITDTDDLSHVTWFHALKTILVTLSTISNPVLYGLSSKRFRGEAMTMVTCRKLRPQEYASSPALHAKHQAATPTPPNNRARQKVSPQHQLTPQLAQHIRH